ncbi:MAG: hypothetical protein S4CHLAM20_03780 [Chlamydiia bacterium]|nr:hypothetical protein [Chlamydiia bacterium]
MRKGGLEPPREKFPLAPQASASTIPPLPQKEERLYYNSLKYNSSKKAYSFLGINMDCPGLKRSEVKLFSFLISSILILCLCAIFQKESPFCTI